MPSSLDVILARAVSPASVRPDGSLTSPRTWGVYDLGGGNEGTRRFRFGNHPIRQRQLELEFGVARLLYLFRTRDNAAEVAKHLNTA